MGITIINVRMYEGRFLVYNRPANKLSFMEKGLDNKENLTVGEVHGGEVAGKRVEEWLVQISGKKLAKKGR